MDQKKINEILVNIDKEIAAIKGIVEVLEPKKTVCCYHKVPWSIFEREMVADKVMDIVSDCTMKTDRTRLSIKWEMYRQLRDQLIGR